MNVAGVQILTSQVTLVADAATDTQLLKFADAVLKTFSGLARLEALVFGRQVTSDEDAAIRAYIVVAWHTIMREDQEARLSPNVPLPRLAPTPAMPAMPAKDV